MNNILLFLGCFLLFIFALVRNKKNVTSPPVLFTLGFLVSSFVLMINTNIWNFVISEATLIYILLGNVFFIVGCSFARTKVINKNLTNRFSISRSTIFFWSGLIIIGILLRFYVLIFILGTSSLNNQALGEIRHSEIETPVDSFLKILSPCISAIAIISIMYFFSLQKSTHKKIGPVLLMAGYFFFCMLSSARIEVLYLFIYIFVYYLFFVKGNRLFFPGVKTILISGVFISLFFLTFFLLGFLTGKSQVQTSLFDNVSLYTGSSLGGLDGYYNTFKYNPVNIFTYTCKGIYTLFSYIGVNIKREAVGGELQYFQLGNMDHTSNVYSCYYVLLHDFNIVGSMIAISLEGFVYQKIYNKAKIAFGKNKNLMIMLYIYISPFILLSSIADRFFSTLLTISSIAFFIFAKYSLNASSKSNI
jgi:oligosaccharide repeat unit polymerase